uniref:4-coumarate--CoA ligase n=2 Tax=Chenopodium quinoa TaxID=63459 RepID=A0A803MAQ0_CHEQI
MVPSTPELYELHFGVAMAGGVLSTLNPSLDIITLSTILEELMPKCIFLDHQNIEPVVEILNHLNDKLVKTPLLVLVSISSTCASTLPNSLYYNEILDMGRFDDFEPIMPYNECDPILVTYTSGSTGHPKGVAYSHRAAYLNALGEILRSDLREQSKVVFLWTADLFRANGWGFTWAIAALGGTNVFLSNTNDGNVLYSISLYKVTHLSGHPSILSTIVEENHRNASEYVLPHKVYAHVAGVMPPCDTINKVENMGFEVVHRYGMTEILGPPVINKLWNNNCAKALNSNVNIMDHLMEEFDVKDPNTMKSVPCDGKTLGEVMFKGNALMMGYLKAPTMTKKVFKGGWFHTGDLAVRHQDGRLQLKDRVIDAIVSKGESISSLEIEAVLLTHPKVLQAAVVAMPVDHDSNNDEVPCAFLKLKIGFDASEGEIIQYCSEKLPIQMIPKVVVFGNLAISSTGKVQKFILRELAKSLNNQPASLHDFNS